MTEKFFAHSPFQFSFHVLPTAIQFPGQQKWSRTEHFHVFFTILLDNFLESCGLQDKSQWVVSAWLSMSYARETSRVILILLLRHLHV